MGGPGRPSRSLAEGTPWTEPAIRERRSYSATSGSSSPCPTAGPGRSAGGSPAQTPSFSTDASAPRNYQLLLPFLSSPLIGFELYFLQCKIIIDIKHSNPLPCVIMIFINFCMESLHFSFSSNNVLKILRM